MALSLLIVFRLLSKVMRNKSILCLSYVLPLVGVICMLLFPWQWMAWVMLCVITCGAAMSYPLLLSFLSNAVDGNMQGWIMGVAGALLAFTWVIAGLLIGPLNYINMLLPFLFIAVGYVIALALSVNKRLTV